MMNNRYIRQTSLPEVRELGQSKLHNTSIIIVGCGGLGIPAALYLAGAGIGKIHLVDHDQISLSNLHRQIIYKEKDIGKNKCEVLADHLKSLNSEVSVELHNCKLTYNNAASLFKSVDYVLDCSDNLETRYLINDACVFLNKIFVSASIYKYEGQLATFNTKDGPTYRCMYNVDSEHSSVNSCEETGVLATLPGILGTLQANELINNILQLNKVENNKVLFFNSLTMRSEFFSVERNEKLVLEGKENFEKRSEHNSDLEQLEINDEKFLEYLSTDDVVLIDNREKWEEPKLNLESILSLPYPSDYSKLNDIEKTKILLCFCQSGIRSLKSAEELSALGYTAYSIKNGVESLLNCMNLIREEELVK